MIEDKKHSKKSAIKGNDKNRRKLDGKNRNIENSKNLRTAVVTERSSMKTRKSTDVEIKSTKLSKSKLKSNVKILTSSSRKSEETKSSRNKKKNEGITEEELCPFDSVIFLGDLNYRLDLPRLEVRVGE